MNKMMSSVKLAQQLLRAQDEQQEELQRDMRTVMNKEAMDLREGDCLRDRLTHVWHEIKGVSLYSCSRPDYDSSVDWVYVDGAAYRIPALKRRFHCDGRRFLTMVKGE